MSTITYAPVHTLRSMNSWDALAGCICASLGQFWYSGYSASVRVAKLIKLLASSRSTVFFGHLGVHRGRPRTPSTSPSFLNWFVLFPRHTSTGRLCLLRSRSPDEEKKVIHVKILTRCECETKQMNKCLVTLCVSSRELIQMVVNVHNAFTCDF